MAAKRSFWTTDLADGTKLGIRVAWEGFNGANVSVRLDFSSTDVERRGGTLAIQTSYTPGESGLYGARGRSVIRKATVSSINGDVVGTGRSIKAAAEDYGSKVAQAIVEQRRRAALVEGAAKLSNGTAKTFTFDDDMALAIRNSINLAIARFPTQRAKYAAALAEFDKQWTAQAR